MWGNCSFLRVYKKGKRVGEDLKISFLFVVVNRLWCSVLELSESIDAIGERNVVDVASRADEYAELVADARELLVAEHGGELHVVEHAPELAVGDVAVLDAVEVLEQRKQVDALNADLQHIEQNTLFLDVHTIVHWIVDLVQ